jgi:hypothetical protein
MPETLKEHLLKEVHLIILFVNLNIQGFLKVMNSPSPLTPFLNEGLPFGRGETPKIWMICGFFTRKSSKSSEDSPPQEWGGVGGGVDKSTLRTP